MIPSATELEIRDRQFLNDTEILFAVETAKITSMLRERDAKTIAAWKILFSKKLSTVDPDLFNRPAIEQLGAIRIREYEDDGVAYSRQITQSAQRSDTMMLERIKQQDDRFRSTNPEQAQIAERNRERRLKVAEFLSGKTKYGRVIDRIRHTDDVRILHGLSQFDLRTVGEATL